MKAKDNLNDIISVDFDNVPIVTNEKAKKETWSVLDRVISAEQRSRMQIRTAYGIAALFLICLLCSLYFIFGPESVKPDTEGIRVAAWKTVSSEFGEKRQVTLPDGSVIWLHNGSKIIYPSDFDAGRRQIFAEGEIYAEIAKDVSRPFVISTDRANVIVTGTKFNFKENPCTSDVELALVEGSVSLSVGEGEKTRDFDVEPGTIVRANRDDLSSSVRVFDPSSYVSWTERNVVYFNDETLESIVAELSRTYGVKIEVKRQALLKLRYFASFVNNETPFQILTTLAKDNGMTVAQSGETIVIY